MLYYSRLLGERQNALTWLIWIKPSRSRMKSCNCGRCARNASNMTSTHSSGKSAANTPIHWIRTASSTITHAALTTASWKIPTFSSRPSCKNRSLAWRNPGFFDWTILAETVLPTHFQKHKCINALVNREMFNEHRNL